MPLDPIIPLVLKLKKVRAKLLDMPLGPIIPLVP